MEKNGNNYVIRIGELEKNIFNNEENDKIGKIDFDIENLIKIRNNLKKKKNNLIEKLNEFKFQQKENENDFPLKKNEILV